MYQEKDNTTEVYRGSLMEEKALVFNNTFSKCNYGLTISPGLLILNNIFMNLSTQGIERGIYVDDSNDKSLVDYCLFYNNPTHFDPDIRLGKNIIVDKNPLLTDNLELQTGSPCINAGTEYYNWGETIFKRSPFDYVGNKPDLGAKEFNGSKWAIRQLPVIDAGKDIIILAPVNRVNLEALLADISIIQGNEMKLQWEKVSGPGDVVFSDVSSAVTTAEFSQQGTYVLFIKGSTADHILSDKLRVMYVQDFREQSATVGKGKGLYLEAEDYNYLVGPAEVRPYQGSGGNVIAVQAGQEFGAYSEYNISTQTAGTYYIWIRVAGQKGKENEIYVALNNLKDEKKISGPSDSKFSAASWQQVTFERVPEGSYPLRIRAIEAGVMWDRIFITMDENQNPLD
jgi:hypothetical protein